MTKYKWYPLLFIGLALLFTTSFIACGTAPSSAPSTQPPSPTGQPAKGPAQLKVGQLTIKPEIVMVGDSAAVAAPVTNTGGVGGTYTAILTIDGQEIGRKDVSVEPGGSNDVSFQVTRTTAGNYKLAIGESNKILNIYDWNPYTIQYDNGVLLMTGGAAQGMGLYQERGHIVHYTPPATPFKIQKIRICASSVPRRIAQGVFDNADLNGKQFTVTIWNLDRTKQLWSQDFPWLLFPTTSCTWADIDVPNIRVDNDFHVEVVTHSGNPNEQSFMGIGYEVSKGETRSGTSSKGQLVQLKQQVTQNVNWFIRVEGQGAPSNLK